MTNSSSTTEPTAVELNEQLGHPDVEVLRDACHAGNLRAGDEILWQGFRASVAATESGERGIERAWAHIKHLGTGSETYFLTCGDRYFTYLNLMLRRDQLEALSDTVFPQCRVAVVDDQANGATIRCVGMVRNDMVVNLLLPPHLSAAGPLGLSASPPQFLARRNMAATEVSERRTRLVRDDPPVASPELSSGSDVGRSGSLPRVVLPDDGRHVYSAHFDERRDLIGIKAAGPLVAALTELGARLEKVPVPHYSYPHVIVEFERNDLRWRSGVCAVVPASPSGGAMDGAMDGAPTSRNAVLLLPVEFLKRIRKHDPNEDWREAAQNEEHNRLVNDFVAGNPGLNTATELHLFCDDADLTMDTEDGPVTMIGARINFCYGARYPLMVHRYDVDLETEQVTHINTTIEAVPRAVRAAAAQ